MQTDPATVLNSWCVGDYLWVKPLVANLDSQIAADFRESFSNELKKDHKVTVLDLSDVVFMDSSGLASIVYCFRMVQIKDELVLCSVCERVMRVFQLTRLDNLLRIYREKQAFLAEHPAAAD